MSRTTIIYAPHPDDETLYLGSYITICRERGDRLVLVAATDGGSSGAKADGWSSADLCAIRRVEQASSWRNLTGLNTGSIVRMGCVDSKDPDLRAKVQAKAEELDALYLPDSDWVEHYAAANNGHSQGVDHDALALGLRDAQLGGDRVVKRFANRCTETSGTLYRPQSTDGLNRMKLADSCYEAFGHRSVPSYWTDLRNSGYANRVTG